MTASKQEKLKYFKSVYDAFVAFQSDGKKPYPAKPTDEESVKIYNRAMFAAAEDIVRKRGGKEEQVEETQPGMNQDAAPGSTRRSIRRSYDYYYGGIDRNGDTYQDGLLDGSSSVLSQVNIAKLDVNVDGKINTKDGQDATKQLPVKVVDGKKVGTKADPGAYVKAVAMADAVDRVINALQHGQRASQEDARLEVNKTFAVLEKLHGPNFVNGGFLHSYSDSRARSCELRGREPRLDQLAKTGDDWKAPQLQPEKNLAVLAKATMTENVIDLDSLMAQQAKPKGAAPVSKGTAKAVAAASVKLPTQAAAPKVVADNQALNDDKLVAYVLGELKGMNLGYLWRGAHSVEDPEQQKAYRELIGQLQRSIMRTEPGSLTYKDDEIFGREVEEAIRAIQKRYKLRHDGLAGEKTVTTLQVLELKVLLEKGASSPELIKEIEDVAKLQAAQEGKLPKRVQKELEALQETLKTKVTQTNDTALNNALLSLSSKQSLSK